MFDWLSSIVGEDTAPIVTYLLIFLILLIGFFVGRAALFRMRGGTFVHGGPARKKRLAIIDAAPVDNRRRLVLVKRDQVEHLILIGGMNDLVVERDIEPQALRNVEVPVSTPSKTLRQSKVAPNIELTKPAPAPEPTPAPKPALAVAEPKPRPVPAVPVAPPPVKAPKIENPPPREETAPATRPVAAPPLAKTSETTVASSATAAAGLASVQSSQISENATKEAVKSVQTQPAPTPVTPEPSLRNHSEQETTISPTIDVEPKIEADIQEPINEFVPMSTPEPSAPEKEIPSPKVDAEDEQADADLEDEMEQLLNKLTGPSAT